MEINDTVAEINRELSGFGESNAGESESENDQEFLVLNHPQKPEENEKPKNIDKFGNVFDPNVHQSPTSVTKTGKFRKKRNAIIAVVNPVENNEENNDENTNTQDIENEKQKNDIKSKRSMCRVVAEASANAFLSSGCMICGKDFAADSEERKLIVESFTNYYLSRDIVDIPPGILLTITLSSYTAQKVMTKPTIQERLKLFYIRLIEKIKEWW